MASQTKEAAASLAQDFGVFNRRVDLEIAHG